MASSSYNKFSAYLVAAFFFLNGINNNNIAMADTALIESVCKLLRNNYNFCKSTFNSDRRSATADLVGLGKISIEITIDQLQETLNNLPEIRRNITDQLGLQRLNVCRKDYEAAIPVFEQAFKSMDRGAYSDVVNRVYDGYKFVTDCVKFYPAGESPIAASNIRVSDLTGITFAVINHLMGA